MGPTIAGREKMRMGTLNHVSLSISSCKKIELCVPLIFPASSVTSDHTLSRIVFAHATRSWNQLAIGNARRVDEPASLAPPRVNGSPQWYGTMAEGRIGTIASDPSSRHEHLLLTPPRIGTALAWTYGPGRALREPRFGYLA